MIAQSVIYSGVLNLQNKWSLFILYKFMQGNTPKNDFEFLDNGAKLTSHGGEGYRLCMGLISGAFSLNQML